MVASIVFGFSLYELAVYFFLYGFIGWCCEVVYAAVKHGKFVNRGFLNGPICPIYGVGVILVLVALTPININFFVLFLSAAVLTSVLEFLTGFILEKFFHKTWWDYRAEPFNIMGYVCLKMSIVWGLACVIIIDVVHPSVASLLSKIPTVCGYVFLSIAAVLLVTDFVLTILQLLKLNQRYKLIDKLNKGMSVGSDKLAETLYKTTTGIEEKIAELRRKIENSRLVKAFPRLGSKKTTSECTDPKQDKKQEP